ncbi:MAG: MBL fold metallo-hydrolase [Promethearchaeota archaeon]
MKQDLITISSGKTNAYLHHIDLRSYGKSKMLSAYIGEFDNGSILLDCGSSLDAKNLIDYIKKNEIPLSSFKYLITSHHHFDHAGGMYLVYNFLKKHNPDVKILTNQKTMKLLNDYEHHLNRARRTYGNFVGKMEKIEEKAFEIIKPSNIFDSNTDKFETIDNFYVNEDEIKLGILKTPGHAPDHQSAFFLKNNKIDFIFLGEAVGTIYHSSKLCTMPVSMPIYYNHTEYMRTLEHLKKLRPKRAGFGHFGIINGQENVQKILLEHESFMNLFETKIREYHEQKNETRYIVNKVLPLLTSRTDLNLKKDSVFKGMVLALVYGMMISLGYRPIPEGDLRFFKLYS